MSELHRMSSVYASGVRARGALRRALGSTRRRRSSRVRVLHAAAEAAATPEPLLVVAALEEVSETLVQLRELSGRPKSYLLFSLGLPCEAIAGRVAELDVRAARRVHVSRAATDQEVETFIRRLLAELEADDGGDRILDAWWEKDTLVVLSHRLNRLRVPLERLAVLRGLAADALNAFEVDDEGEFVHWPACDAHLGWEQLLQAVDSRACLRARQQSEEFNRRYGRAIRTVRARHGLRQSDVAGLTPRQLGRIENGRCRATASALGKLAEAHGLPLDSYLQTIAEFTPPAA